MLNLKGGRKNGQMLHSVGINCGKGPFPRQGDGYRPTLSKFSSTQSKT